MEEEVERAMVLEKIWEVLVGGGYFRARISSLPPFDKLTGGLAWCIIASNEDVDFDIFFFDDDATLGEKIEVGEAIESALQRMGCPHALQAHQIQGLDYQALYPVVKWLVHRVSSTRQALGDQLRKYSHLRFHENYHFPDDAHLIPSHMVRLNVASQALREQLVPHGHPPLEDQIMGIRSEDIHSAVLQHSETADIPKKQVLEVQELSRQIGMQVEKNNQLKEQMEISELLVKRLQEDRKEQMKQNATVQEALQSLQNRVNQAGVSDVVDKLCSLLEQLKSLEKEELDFRLYCKKQDEERQNLLQQLENVVFSLKHEASYQDEIDGTFDSDIKKLKSLQEDYMHINQKVVLLQRKLDEIPSQTELMQYERCFVELFQQIQGKLRETRKYYATYNALAEANDLSNKEISLLNSINLQFETTMSTTEGRTKFVESLDLIAKGVQQKVEKMDTKLKTKQKEITSHKEKHGKIVAARREYVALMKIFQDECAKNEKLQQALKGTSA